MPNLTEPHLATFHPKFPISITMSIKHSRAGATTRAGGFTVVELVAVLAVLALLASAALPFVQGVVDRMRLTNEALALKLFLERTYSHALTAREGLSIECAERSLAAYRKTGEILATHSLSHGASLDLSSLSDRKLLFHPSIAASPATLTLKRAKRSCRVIISLRGRVRVAC